MTQKLGYLVDLSTVKFDDDSTNDTSTWIQAAPLGKYTHPLYGEIEFTPERIQRFADNVNNKVRGQDLNIDYDHKEGEAAGWVKQAEARSDGLWILVEWTKKAYNLLKDKAYRYFSPEFNDTWSHPKTKQEYKDVLFGGGITNRPFLKDILPINLSEVFDNEHREGGNAVDPEKLKALREKYGLADDATEDQVIDAALAAELRASEENAPENEGAEKEKELVPSLSDVAGLKKLAEENPAVKLLMDNFEVMGKQLQDNTKKLKEAAVDKAVTKLSEQAAKKSLAIPPAAKEALTKALTEASEEQGQTILAAFEKLVDAGLVQMKEIGGGDPNADKNDGVKKFNDAVAEFQKKNEGVSYADAVVTVAQQQPQLYTEYREASYAFAE